MNKLPHTIVTISALPFQILIRHKKGGLYACTTPLSAPSSRLKINTEYLQDGSEVPGRPIRWAIGGGTLICGYDNSEVRIWELKNNGSRSVKGLITSNSVAHSGVNSPVKIASIACLLSL